MFLISAFGGTRLVRQFSIVLLLILGTRQWSHMRDSSPSRPLVRFYKDDTSQPVNFSHNISVATNPQHYYSQNDPLLWRAKQHKQSFWVENRTILKMASGIAQQSKEQYIPYKWGSELSYDVQTFRIGLGQTQFIAGLAAKKADSEVSNEGVGLYFQNLREAEVAPETPSQDKAYRLSLSDINKIGQPEFLEWYDYSELLRVYRRESLDDTISTVLIRLNFHFQLYGGQRPRTILTSINGPGYDINYFRNFSCPANCPKQEIPTSPDRFDRMAMMELARGGYTVIRLQETLEQNARRERTYQLLEYEMPLEEKLQEIKARVKHLKRLRQQKKKKQYSECFTQIQKPIPRQNIWDVIEFNALSVIRKVEDLTRIKAIQLREGKSKDLVYPRIHAEVGELLFSLLIHIITGEEFVNLRQLMVYESQQQVESMLLTLIAANLDSLEGKRYASGLTKIELLRFYNHNKIMIDKEGGPKFGHAAQQTRPRRVANPVNKTSEKRKKQNINLKTEPTPPKYSVSPVVIAAPRIKISPPRVSSNKLGVPSARHFQSASLYFPKRLDASSAAKHHASCRRKGDNQQKSPQRSGGSLLRPKEKFLTPRYDLAIRHGK